jgi:hypothetical protein
LVSAARSGWVLIKHRHFKRRMSAPARHDGTCPLVRFLNGGSASFCRALRGVLFTLLLRFFAQEESDLMESGQRIPIFLFDDVSEVDGDTSH